MNDLTIAEPIAADAIRSRILTIRGVQVILDRDLAELYGVPTKRLNEQVKRNAERFPVDFMFHLSKTEMAELVANCDLKRPTSSEVSWNMKRSGKRFLLRFTCSFKRFVGTL